MPTWIETAATSVADVISWEVLSAPENATVSGPRELGGGGR